MTTQQETSTINGELRETLGKKVRFLRRQGITPANLYGRAVESISFQAPTKALERLIQQGGRSSLVTLSINGTSYQALLRNLQRHPVTRAILHADFYRVDLSRPIQAQVPLHLVGEAPAAKIPDALITQALHEITVECLPADIPQSIEVDISDLTAMEMSIHIRDIQPPANVTLVAEGEVLVVRVGQSRVTAAAEALEAEGVEEGVVEAVAGAVEGEVEASTDDEDGA